MTNSNGQHAVKKAVKETAQELLAQSAAFSRTVSERQSQQASNLSRAAFHWNNAMDYAAHDDFQAVADALNARTGRTGRQALSAYMAFSQCTLTCQTCQMPLPAAPTQAPFIQDPPALPTLTLEASITNGVFALVLRSPGYADAVIITACDPMLPRKAVRLTHGFVLLQTQMSLSSALDLTDAFTRQQRAVPPIGSKLAVLVTPVSATGFRGKAVLTTALVTMALAKEGEGLPDAGRGDAPADALAANAPS